MHGDRKQVEGARNRGGQRELPGENEGFSCARWTVVERGGGEGHTAFRTDNAQGQSTSRPD